MNEIKLLQAPDRSRYVFYKKKPKRVLKFESSSLHKVPEMTETQEEALANTLMREHFLYIEEQIRKFWDDLNGIHYG